MREGANIIAFSLIQKAMQGYEDLKSINYPHISKITYAEFNSQEEVIVFRDKEDTYITAISY